MCNNTRSIGDLPHLLWDVRSSKGGNRINFKPDRDNILKQYKFVVILETDENRQGANSKQHYEYYHKAQIVICETTDGSMPLEVGT